jgi:hypothetical protein
MRILRKPADAAEIGDPALRRLVEQRFAEIGEDGCFDTETMGNFIVVEAGDSARQIEAESGCPILTDCFGEARYGDADFTPAFEWAMAMVPSCSCRTGTAWMPTCWRCAPSTLHPNLRKRWWPHRRPDSLLSR